MHAADQVKEVCLPRTIGADDGMNLPLSHLQVNIMESTEAVEVFHRFPDFEDHPSSSTGFLEKSLDPLDGIQPDDPLGPDDHHDDQENPVEFHPPILDGPEEFRD